MDKNEANCTITPVAPVVGRFEKVSLENFSKADTFDGITQDEIKCIYDHIELPKRATAGSCGYDIRTPFSICLSIGHSVKIPTGICARITDGWWLMCVPRSSIGFKYRIQLANTCGVIDSDYYGNVDNGGHIFIKLYNAGDKEFTASAGDAIVQAIFVPYGITADDTALETRIGGIGSTGR